MQAQNLLTGDS